MTATTDTDPATDGGRALAIRARAGDEQAFTALVERFSGPLYGYLRQMRVAEHDAEDLVQDTFIRAYRALDRYDERYACSTWLFTIARRLTLNHFRDRKPQVAVEIVPDAATTGEESRVEDRDHAGWLWGFARTCLGERDFEALWLHYAEGLDHRDIASILAIGSTNARVLLHRARKRLRRQLEREHPAHIQEERHAALASS